MAMMDAAGGWSSELAYAALGAITTEPIGQSPTQSAPSHPPHTTRAKSAAHRFSRAALLTHPAHYFRRRVTAAVALARIGPLQDAMEESDPCVFIIEYCDGFRAFLLGMGSYKVPRNIDDGQICESNLCATRK